MKKFLFTLAATMLAGSMFAGQLVEGSGTEYFYMDDIELTAATQTVSNAPVKAHLGKYISGWQADLGVVVDGEYQMNVLPAGMTITSTKAGADMTLTYTDDSGDPECTVTPSLGKSQGNTRFIVANIEGNYWDPDGDEEYEFQGVAKWAPGEYAKMWTLTMKFTEEFTGTQTIRIQTKATCGRDNNTEWELSDGATCWYDFTIKAYEAPQPQDEVADPTINFVEVDATHVKVVVACETEGATLYVNGTAVEGNPYEYIVEHENIYADQVVNVSAYAVNGTATSETVTDSYTFHAQEMPFAGEPTKVETVNADNVVVNFTPAEGTTIVVKVNGEEVEIPYTIDRPEWDQEAIEVTFVVTASGTNMQDKDYTYTVTVQPKAKPDQTAAPEIVVTNDADNWYVKAVGNGTITLKVMTGDDRAVYTATGENETNVITLPRLDEDYPAKAEATAQVAGELESEKAEKTFTVLKKEAPQPQGTCTTPDGQYNVTEGQHEVVVTLTPAADNEKVYYRIIYTDGEGNTTVGEWTEYTNPVAVTADGHYRVEFYGAAENMNNSEVGAVEFYVTPTTGLDEVANGKAIAGVRYFNMAGQEMQEANGVTIVVTTYTDGTTSAVKVIK